MSLTRLARSLAIGLSLPVVVAAPVFATDCIDYANYLRVIEGFSVDHQDVVPAGSNVVASSGSDGVVVYDGSSLENLIPLGTLDTPGFATRLAVSADLVLIADDTGGLRIVDISTPSSPVSVGHLALPDPATDVAVSGSLSAVLSRTGSRLFLVDVADPALPVLLGQIDLVHGSTSSPSVIALSGDHAYVCIDYDGVQIIDISDPTTPAIVTTVDTPRYATGIAIEGDRAYVTDYGGLRVLDISVPAQASIVGGIPTESEALDVNIVGTIGRTVAYVASYTSGVIAVDISRAPAVWPIGQVAFHTAGRIAVVGSAAFALGSSNLHTVDVSNPLSPDAVGSLLPGGPASDVVSSGAHAYVGRGSDLQVVDISNPTSPSAVGSVSFGFTVADVELSGDHAFVAAGPELHIVDVSNPTSPQSLSSSMLNFWVRAVVVDQEQQAYVSTVFQGDRALVVLDVSDPSNPVILATLDSGVEAGRMDMTGDHLFICGVFQVQVIDVSNPTAPSAVTTIPISAGGVTIVGTRAYFAERPLAIYDVSVPTNPIPLGSSSTVWAWSEQVAVDGTIAYVAADDVGVQVFDVADPGAIELIGSVYPWPTRTEGVAVSQAGLLTASSESGVAGRLDIFPLQCTTVGIPSTSSSPSMMPVSSRPHPLRGAGYLRFVLPTDSRVRLSIYDVAGRRARELDLGPRPAGASEIPFDGRDDDGRPLGAGVWFVRLEGSGFGVTSRLVVVR